MAARPRPWAPRAPPTGRAAARRPHWPDRARLCDHQNPLTLGSDTELLKYCGKRLEVVHGEDTSNGWAYTHALGKLKAYQALLVP